LHETPTDPETGKPMIGKVEHERRKGKKTTK
jgi:hypothetical protein